MILVVALLTPFTMSDSVSLFFAFRIIQTRLMLLSIVHGLNPNQKLKAILKGRANRDHLWGSTLEAHQRFSQAFFLPQSVYIRFTHINNFQPKFYLGSALHHVLDREYSRTRKYYQLTHDRLFKRNWPCATGGNRKTCSSGSQSLFLPAAPTSGAWNLPSSKSGNHG